MASLPIRDENGYARLVSISDVEPGKSNKIVFRKISDKPMPAFRDPQYVSAFDVYKELIYRVVRMLRTYVFSDNGEREEQVLVSMDDVAKAFCGNEAEMRLAFRDALEYFYLLTDESRASELDELFEDNDQLREAAKSDAAEISRLLDINKQLQEQLIASTESVREADEKLNDFERRLNLMRERLNRLTIGETINA